MRTSIWLLVFLHRILSCFLANPQNSPIRPKPVLVWAEAYCRIKAPNLQRNSSLTMIHFKLTIFIKNGLSLDYFALISIEYN